MRAGDREPVRLLQADTPSLHAQGLAFFSPEQQVKTGSHDDDDHAEQMVTNKATRVCLLMGCRLPVYTDVNAKVGKGRDHEYGE